MICDIAVVKAQVRNNYATSFSLEIYRKRIDNGAANLGNHPRPTLLSG